jgi:DNA-binding NtrC family response regulator
MPTFTDVSAQDETTLRTESEGDAARVRGRRHLCLSILWHPDVSRVGDEALLVGATATDPMPVSRIHTRFFSVEHGRAHSLGNKHLSRKPLLLVPQPDAGVQVRCEGTTTRVEVNGRRVVGSLAIGAPEIDEGAVLELGGRVALVLHLRGSEPRSGGDPLGLVGRSDAMEEVRAAVRRVADLEVPVLLRGESGSGKELVARAIHRASSRRDRPFIAVNVGAVPPSLAASELFGAVKGAYTGAVADHRGFFGAADGGTLLLDEIGDTPLEVQVALLRILETGEVQRVGSRAAERVDVRVIAATDRDLRGAVDAGTFRAPLLYRLAGYELRVPPLRERRDDFGRLLVHFLRRELEAIGEVERLAEAVLDADDRWLRCSAVATLARHGWPGNVRQLHNMVRQLVITSRGRAPIDGDPVVTRLVQEVCGAPCSVPPPAEDSTDPSEHRVYRKPDEVTEDEIVEALRSNGWELKAAAAALGISRTSLYARVARSSRVRMPAQLDRADIEAALEARAGSIDAAAADLQVSAQGLRQRIAQLGLGRGRSAGG